VTTIRVNGTIHRPVEEVWAILGDPENAPNWSRNAISEELTSPRPIGVGTTRRAVVKGFRGGTMENHAVCTEYEPPRRIAWQTTSAAIPFHVVVDLKKVDGGTRLESVWTLGLRGPMRLAAPLIGVIFTRILGQDVANLKVLLESGEIQPRVPSQ
jgi:uncharacterized protein YndB with AHSA1/START domain